MTGNHYVLTGRVDWADEFDVHFFEVLTEEEYQKYKAAQDILGSFCGDLYFGTNEGWDADFDYLDFNPQPISQEELNFINRVGIGGERVVRHFMYVLNDAFVGYGVSKVSPFNMSLEEFKEACTKLHNILVSEDEDDE